MKLKNIITSFAALLLCAIPPSAAWGGFEHTVAAYAAQSHLTPNTLRNLRRYLDQPITGYAEWMDYLPLQKSPEYRPLMGGMFHCFLVKGPEFTPQETSPYDTGDGQGIVCMDKVLRTLEHHREFPDSLVTLHLRCFIHLIGDMHCPAHIIFYDKSDGNPDIFLNNMMWKRVWYEGKKDNFHSMWDSALVRERPDYNYDDWAKLLDNWTEERQREACRGTVRDWVSDNARRCEVIYRWMTPGAQYSSSFYSGDVAALAHYQLTLSIYRMAYILNRYFDYE